MFITVFLGVVKIGNRCTCMYMDLVHVLMDPAHGPCLRRGSMDQGTFVLPLNRAFSHNRAFFQTPFFCLASDGIVNTGIIKFQKG